jgi:hypothetical protein
VPSSGYVTRASSHRLPTARSAGNRVEAADGASFVVFIHIEGADRPSQVQHIAGATWALAEREEIE